MAAKDKYVFITEGEKTPDTQALVPSSIEYAGAGKWTDELGNFFISFFEDRRCSRTTTKSASITRAVSLSRSCASCRMSRCASSGLIDLPPKGDDRLVAGLP